MNFAETVRTSLDAIFTHRMRSLLTMLGILIGIAAVILTVGLGQGAQNQVASQINKLGSNLLVISPGSTSTSGIRGGRGTASTLTSADATALADKSVAPDIAAVAPVSTGSLDLVAGDTNWTTSVVGTTPSWMGVRARSMTSGRFITNTDLNSSAQVVVLGATTAQELFNNADPVGQAVTVNGTSLTVIGVLNSVGTTVSGTDEDDTAIVPQTTYQTMLSTSANRTSISSLYIEAASSTSLSAAYQEADQALLTAHHDSIRNADFTITSQESLLQTATATDKTLTVLLGGVAAISLLVGGLGVMNIMLVSVSERVREIGLRKALGATPKAIRKQFLIEASILGLAGGVLGLVLAGIGIAILPSLLGQPVVVVPLAVIGGLIVSLLIGTVAGVYPANRAAHLSPIDALRSE